MHLISFKMYQTHENEYTHIFFISREKNFSASFILIFFIVLFYCSIVLPIVLQSNLQPNYAYLDSMLIKKNEHTLSKSIKSHK